MRHLWGMGKAERKSYHSKFAHQETGNGLTQHSSIPLEELKTVKQMQSNVEAQKHGSTQSREETFHHGEELRDSHY